MAEIQVIGGGFSGLSAAYFFMNAGHRVRIVETGERIGGLLETLQTPYGPVETAANALIANSIVEKTASDLGIPLSPALKTARRRFILRDKKLQRWPLRAISSLRLLGIALPLRIIGRSPLLPRPRESVRSWGERTIGREATDYLLGPALAGIYASDLDQLSANLTLAKFFRRSKKVKLPRGRLRGSVAPIKGMGAWAPAFRRSLELNQCSFASEAVAGLPTIVALPPPAASKFLAGRAPALEAELKKITMLPIVTVTAFFSPETSSVPGFGCLFPKREGYRALGVLANDRIFPNRSMDSLAETWLFGGALDSDILRLSDREILDLLIEERTKMHGVRPRLLHSKVTRWEGAIPHYDIHLENALENLATMEFREGNFRLFGNYLGELGLGTILSKAAELPKEFP